MRYYFNKCKIFFVLLIAFLWLFSPIKGWIRQLSKTNKFRLQISEPIVVGQKQLNKEEDWGFFQFPRMCYTENGYILIKIANKEDSIKTYSGEYLYYISEDKGETWRECNETDSLSDLTLLMENGRYYQGPIMEDAICVTEKLDDKVPYYSSEDGSYRLFQTDEISFLSDSFIATEYDQNSNTEETFKTHYLWNNRSFSIINDYLIPDASWLYHYKMHSPNSIIKEDNGDLFAAVYGYGGGIDITAVGDLYMYNVFLLRSIDNGRTWKYVSNILSEGICEAGSEGLCEPCMTITPDGRYFILMRSGAGFPCYCSYSLDKGQSWSRPQEFADVGVDPQLLTLDCGVTLASYGRPGIFVQATDDPACLAWQAARRIKLSEENIENPYLSSCCYTSLIMVDKYTALLAYSDFNYPSLVVSTNPNAKIKTILVRKIHVEYDY